MKGNAKMQKSMCSQQLKPDEESFVVVNGYDKYLYVVKGKENLHKHKLLHRGIHIFVETTDNKLIVQKKAPGTENEYKWSSSVSGHVRCGESYIMAALREMEEELGINANISDLKEEFKLKPNEKTNNEFVTLFSYIMDTDKTRIKLESDEVLEVKITPKLVVIEDMRKNPSIYSPAFIFLMEKYLRS